MTDGGGGRGVGEAKRGQKAAQGGCGEVGMAQSGLRRVLQRTSRQPGESATDSSSNVVRQHGANAQVEEWRGEEEGTAWSEEESCEEGAST